MTEEFYKAPESELVDAQSIDAELWNPDAAGAWSILFTPLFGSILVYKNWNSLGESKLAAKAKKWIYISVFMIFVSFFVNFVAIIYIITWYFLCQKRQTKYLKETHNGIYQKKGWLKPLAIALVSFLTLLVLVGVVSMAFLVGANALINS